MCECLWKLSLALLSYPVNKLCFFGEVVCIPSRLHLRAFSNWMHVFFLVEFGTFLFCYIFSEFVQCPPAYRTERIISYCCTVTLKSPTFILSPAVDDFSYIYKKKHHKDMASLIMPLRFLSHRNVRTNNDCTLFSWQCLMCQWICYCFSDGTTERWRQNVRQVRLNHDVPWIWTF